MTVTHAELLCVSNIRDYERHYIDFEFLVDAEGEAILKEPETCRSWNWYSLDRLPVPLFRPVEIALQSYHKRQSNEIIYNP